MKSKDDRIHKLKLKAYHYLHYRARTVHEMREYLTQKAQKHPELFPYIDDAILFLLEEHYLDDKQFIEEYVQSRIKNRPRSEYLIKRELKAKGVGQGDIDAYFDMHPLDGLALATKALVRVVGRWRGLHTLKKKKKIYDYLARRGFSYDIIRAVYEGKSTE